MSAEELKEKIRDSMNGAAICMALSIAKKTGLLQVFTDPHEPMTIPEIAAKAKLKPRYVKELLGCLVTGNIIDTDDKSEKYFISEEIRPTLHEQSFSIDLMDYVIERKNDVIACTKIDGPNGYSGQSKPGYGEVLNNMRCLDIDSYIQEIISTPDVQTKLEEGIDFIEFGCGLAPIILELATRYPNSRFTASDYSSEAIATVKDVIQERCLTNIKAHKADLYDLPKEWKDTFDVIYIRDTLHDLGDPYKGATEMVKVAKRGGVLVILEIGMNGETHREHKEDPFAPQFYLFSTAICVPESLCQGGIGLGCTSGVKTIQGVVEQAGIPKENIEMVTTGSWSLKFVCRKK